MEDRGKNGRSLGIDALRALSMFFVLCQHILGQGGVAEAARADPGKYWLLRFLQILSYCAVDIYGLTTGYLLCQKSFRLSRLTKLWLTTVFWSVAVSCGFFAFVPESRSLSEAVSMFLPILRGRYWFFTAYFVVMLVSPVLNLLIRTMSRRQFRLLLAVLFVIFGIIPVGSLGYDVMRISGGNHFAWMITLYLIGGYLRIHGPAPGVAPTRKLRWLGGYFLFALGHLAYMIGTCLIGLGNWSSLFLTCVSPLIVGEAICLFLFFREAGANIRETGIAGKLIGFVTPGVYAVYIIHVHPGVFWDESIIALFRSWDSRNGLQVLGATLVTSLAVFMVCILLDALRQRLFRLLRLDRAAQRISDRVEETIRRLVSR